MAQATIKNEFSQFLLGKVVGDKTFGYIVQTWMYGTEIRACVQKGIATATGYKPWGAWQPSKVFKTEVDARQWAYATAKARIAKLAK